MNPYTKHLLGTDAYAKFKQAVNEFTNEICDIRVDEYKTKVKEAKESILLHVNILGNEELEKFIEAELDI